jgi:hypothetical protein
MAVVVASALLPQVPVSTMPAVRGAELRKPAFEARVAGAAPQGPPPGPAGRVLSPGAATVQVPLSARPASAAAR